MKLQILDASNKKTGDLDLPVFFNEPLNDDLIRHVFNALSISSKQPYGSDPRAGKKSVAKLSRRRRKWKTSYGIGISRVPRKIMSHSGTRFNWVGAFAPGTVGGRRAHPPKPFKLLERKINKKEKRKALLSAIAATMSPAIVSRNGYRLPQAYPFALDASFEKLEKTKQVQAALEALGFSEELTRADQKKVRAGRGTMRSRTYRKKLSLLLVLSGDAALAKASRNIPGIESVSVNKLSVIHLAPAARGGRLALFTAPAVEALAKRMKA